MKHRAALVILALACACAKQSAAPGSETPKAVAPEPGVPGGIPGEVAPQPGEPATEDTSASASAPTPEQVARVEAVRDREFAVVERDPRFEKELQRMVEGVTDPAVAYARGRTLGATLSSRGMARLSDAMLERWMSVRSRMLLSSEEACAGLWAGPISDDALMLAMASLDDEMLTDFVRITAAATLAELSAKTDIVFDLEGLVLGIRALTEPLSLEEGQRFIDTVNGAHTTASDQCFASRVLHDRVAGIAPDLRARFIRALAASMAAPP